MANLKELLGNAYKSGMTIEEAENALAGKNLVDLSTGEYVSKAKYRDDTKELATYKAQVEGKQAEIDEAVAKAVEKTKAEAKTEYEKLLETERTANKRKRAKEKAYDGLTEEQKGLYDAFIKDEELKLSEDGNSFSNFEEHAKIVREKFKTVFPIEDGTHGKAGLPPTPGKSQTGKFEYEEFKNLR